MGQADFYEEGGWNAICFECGRKFKAGTMLRHWQGYYVCPGCWEPRHPQDFVRGVPERPTPAWVQFQHDQSPNLMMSTDDASGGQGIFPGAPVTIASLTVYDFILDYLGLAAAPSWLETVVIMVPENTVITSLIAGTAIAGVTITINNFGRIDSVTDPSSLLTVRTL